MADILKGVSGGWSFLVSWIFPSALAWSVFALFAFPHLERLPVFGDIASAANQTLVLLGASLLTGLLLSTLSTVLFRILEGYVLIPQSLASKMRIWQLRSKFGLERELSELLAMRKSHTQGCISSNDDIDGRSMRQGQNQEGKEIVSGNHEVATLNPLTGLNVRIGLIRERLRRYPADAREIGPTRFSNALRAIETYGWDRYRMDSQTLWSELQTVVPQELTSEHERARAPINFFVSLIYLSFIQTLVCVALLLRQSGPTLSLILVGAASALLIPAWYRLAVLNTRYLMAVMQATVNVGRLELAAKMGLAIPPKLQDERDMWERLFWFVHEPFEPKYAEDLDAYRIVPGSSPTNDLS